MFSKMNSIFWPELWLLKFYFHQHYHCAAIGRPFLISYLFQHGHFLVLGRNFFTARVFLVEIMITYTNDDPAKAYSCRLITWLVCSLDIASHLHSYT